MLGILKAVSETSVPSLLLGLGGLLLLLAFVQKIGTQIELPASRQRMAAIVGTLLVLLGTFLNVAPMLATGSAPGTTGVAGGDAPAAVAVSTPRAESPAPQAPPAAGGTTETRREAVSAPAPAQPQHTDVVYRGPLRDVITSTPGLKDLLGGLDHIEKRALSVDWVVNDFTGEKSRMRAALEGSDYQGIDDIWGGACDGSDNPDGVAVAVITVDSFVSPDAAARYWAVHAAQPKGVVGKSVAGDPDAQLWEQFTDCDAQDALLHWRSVLDGNLVLHAILTVSDRPMGDPGIDTLSARIIDALRSHIADLSG